MRYNRIKKKINTKPNELPRLPQRLMPRTLDPETRARTRGWAQFFDFDFDFKNIDITVGFERGTNNDTCHHYRFWAHHCRFCETDSDDYI